jgi:aminopeptidase YwaD
VAGTPASQAAAEYLAAQLRQYGYPVEFHGFRFPYYEERRVELVQTTPAPRSIAAKAMFYSASTPPGGVEAEAVFVGFGRPQDFDGRRVRGAIAVTEAGWIHPSEKVANVVGAGAVGAVVFDNQPEGIVARTLGRRSTIPAVGISQEDGRRLVAAMREGSVKLRLHVDGLFEDRSSVNVVATRQGTSRPGEIIIVGAHYDSVPGSPGANDNASGVAAVLEVARALATTPVRRTVQYVLFGAEEFGLYGSFAYSNERRHGVVAMVNLDMVGWGERLMVGNSPGRDNTAVIVALRVAAELGIPVTRFHSALSDHAMFERFGIPSVFLHRGTDPHYHRPTDVPPVVDPRNLEEASRLVIGLLLHPAFPTAAVDRRLVGVALP